MFGAAQEKARLPRFSSVLGTEGCCEADDVSCLVMFDKEISQAEWLMCTISPPISTDRKSLPLPGLEKTFFKFKQIQ